MSLRRRGQPPPDMRIELLTLFPDMFRGPFDESMVRRAIDKNLVSVRFWNFRDFAVDRHRTVDDSPYGGGAGMLLKPEPIFACVDAVFAGEARSGSDRVILLTPQGERLNHRTVERLSEYERLVLICGRYEGFDERIRSGLVDEEVSIGDYVLAGGELPAMVLVDAVVRQIKGVLGSENSLEEESFSMGRLEYPQYTRPAEFRGMAVPEVLLSGNHAEIARWRGEEAQRRTETRRPDLLSGEFNEKPGDPA